MLCFVTLAAMTERFTVEAEELAWTANGNTIPLRDRHEYKA